MDCTALFEHSEVREAAGTSNRVSDYLGHMWRKGVVVRLPAPKIDGIRSRWLYMLKDVKKVKPVADVTQAISFDEHVEQIINRPHLQVTEEGDAVVITLPNITITIRQNK